MRALASGSGSSTRPPRAARRPGRASRGATGAVETDYLNGEIVLLGRLHGVATPVNDAAVPAGRAGSA